ncbi:unnamed protein product [Arabis nemorensis]|uniref:Uncharacterized protein n=1 Tax=Arabis nemorensis TaxID=586526 RepID=A0A565CST6_9BRAS|nr:unnamed protein product [Arabis nemorensis]
MSGKTQGPKARGGRSGGRGKSTGRVGGANNREVMPLGGGVPEGQQHEDLVQQAHQHAHQVQIPDNEQDEEDEQMFRLPDDLLALADITQNIQLNGHSPLKKKMISFLRLASIHLYAQSSFITSFTSMMFFHGTITSSIAWWSRNRKERSRLEILLDNQTRDGGGIWSSNISKYDPDGPNNSENPSERSTQRTLTIDEENKIFLKCTRTDNKGNPFGLGELPLVLGKRKRKESYKSTSTDALTVIQQKLDAAEEKIAAQEKENARWDQEHRAAQAQISKMAKLIRYTKNSDLDCAACMREQAPACNSPTTDPSLAQGTSPVTAAGTTKPTGPVTTPNTQT